LTTHLEEVMLNPADDTLEGVVCRILRV
jgi:hypothetical protein